MTSLATLILFPLEIKKNREISFCCRSLIKKNTFSKDDDKLQKLMAMANISPIVRTRMYSQFLCILNVSATIEYLD